VLVGALALLSAGGLATSAARADTVRGVARVAASTKSLYTSNRAPLAASRLVRLPIGSITPKGWLRGMLVLASKGMTGHLEEISPWCRFSNNAWSDPKGQGHSGWEELPYWLKGYGDLGYVLGNKRIIQGARKWIEAVLSSQDEDGWFGPRGLKTSLDGKPDLWPHMVMLNVLQSYYEYTGDKRVLPFMTRYFRWELGFPEADFMAGYWPPMRAGDNLESVYWLYNRTGETWLLDLARKIHRKSANWTSGLINWHGVNISQGFREPGVYFTQARDPRFLKAAERNWRTIKEMYGQYPGGGFGADENARPGYTDPRQGFETCSIVEFMHSAEMLTRVSGDPVWADRCEEMALNTFPAAMTPDQKALHYLTCANQIQLDKGNKAPGIQNGGTMFSYSPFEAYRCCQHNVSHGWPYYAEELWLATADRGLCASLYAASEVTAKVGTGTQVRVSEETDYPFRDTLTFRVSTPRPERFPLYLRVPRWCASPQVSVNGRRLPLKAKPLSFLVVDRTWRQGDRVTLRLPMSLAVKTWAKSRDAVSVSYGPLNYSLQIGEKWSRCGGTRQWPETELRPTTPWNYGLVLSPRNPASSFRVVTAQGAVPAQPFTPEAAPLRLLAKARRIPAWRLDENGLVNPLQQSPALSTQPLETVTLIPMGCARLRVTAFPTIGSGPGAHQWKAAATSAYAAEASHVNASDTVRALSDGLEPKSSSDGSIPRFTWWDHKGGTEWVQYRLPKARTLSSVSVYWFDDRPGGGCRVPASWRLLYKTGTQWKPVEAAGDYGVAPNAYNRVAFTAITTQALRLEVQLQPGFSGGILEWKLK
jgi:hypothetical protein